MTEPTEVLIEGVVDALKMNPICRNNVERKVQIEYLRNILQDPMAGWTGFIYHQDCSDFIRKHKHCVWDLISGLAEDVGMSETVWINNLRRNRKLWTGVTASDLMRSLGFISGKSDPCLDTWLACVCLESVASHILDIYEHEEDDNA